MSPQSLRQLREDFTQERNPSSKADSHVSLIREELIALTKNHGHAIVLNQLLYWTLRTKDFHLMLEEEHVETRKTPSSPQYGWIYKTAYELIQETMLTVSHPTMRAYLKQLIQKGWIQERQHPFDKWNKTLQYRVNLKKLHHELQSLGKSLPSMYLKAFCPLFCEVRAEATSSPSNVTSFPLREISLEVSKRNFSPVETSKEKSKLCSKPAEIPKERNLPSNVKLFPSNVRNLHSNTETTPEITNREHAQDAREGFEKNFKDVFAIWQNYVGQDVHPTLKRQQRLKSLLSLYFENDLGKWKSFCERIKTSPFLMGNGSRKWRVSLDWILDEGNLLKVLEGNFDDPETFEQQKEAVAESGRQKEISSLLASIADPLWRRWCSQLDFNLYSRDSVSIGDLKEIANAWFLEVEDDRLVWIGSSSQRTLDRIEDLRMKIFTIIEKTFSQTRTFRTRLCEESSLKERDCLQSIPSTPNLLRESSYAQ